MRILYSGAIKDGAEQLDSNLSLGGLISGSDIPNDLNGNLFSLVSIYSLQNKKRETKLIVLKNDEGDIVSNLKFKFIIESDSICKYRVAFVYPKITSTSICFEQIINSSALPYYAQFQNITNNTEFVINHIANGGFLGIWISREFNFDSLDLKKKTQQDWLDELVLIDANNGDPIEKNTIENFSFDLTYSIGESSSSNSNSNSNSLSTSNNGLVTVTNSNGSFILSGNSPLILPDTIINIVIDGDIVATFQVPTLGDDSINLHP